MLEMRKMKDSGIEWIGEIPEGWEVTKLKNIVSIVRGGSPRPIEAYMSDNDNDVNWIRISDTEKGSKYITHTSRKLIASGISKSRFIKRGSLILTNSMSFGEPYILDIDGCIHDGWVAFSDFKKIDKEFLYYFLTSPLAKIQFEQQVDGGVVKNLNIDKIGDTVILLPSLIDQNKIIAHLDSLTSETNSLLSKTITSIEEYKKLKQAVITQAVTKGVRGEREMKDSGVEWIGEIPKKWNRCKLNSICTFINGDRSKNYPSPEDFQDIGIPFIGADSLNGFFVDTYSARHISPAKYASMGGLKITQGDILYTLRGSTIGKNAIANFNDGTIASSLVGIRVKSPFLASSSFLFYWLNSLNEFVQRDLCINGSTAPNLSAENVAQFFIYIPDITEQHEIADYLDAKCAEIDGLIEKKEHLLKELESYKKSLIYEVVTGKREV